MEFGICNLSVIAVRLDSDHSSEQTNQLLFGEYFKIIDKIGSWTKIENAFDAFIGWIDNKQYTPISEEEIIKMNSNTTILSNDFIDFVFDNDNNMIPIPLGSILPFYTDKTFVLDNKELKYEGDVIEYKSKEKALLVNSAFMYLNSPYQWGGKSPLGIDCSGFTQMVYKLNGVQIPRNADKQALTGEVLSFIEESEPGDLAFFDNEEGEIIHVGIILENNYIIHAHGKVRIDRIDHSGIFNVDTKRHSHKLRVIKKIC
ncbi:MAG: C40 family peptidase [Flavobacteriales bacterium]|nr:C40 family peptidase [Flavobacteriales bacterium]